MLTIKKHVCFVLTTNQKRKQYGKLEQEKAKESPITGTGLKNIMLHFEEADSQEDCSHSGRLQPLENITNRYHRK